MLDDLRTLCTTTQPWLGAAFAILDNLILTVIIGWSCYEIVMHSAEIMEWWTGTW